MMSVESLCTKVVCVECKSSESSFWHKSNGGPVCTSCYCRRDVLSRATRSQGFSSNSSSATRVGDEPRSTDAVTTAAKSGCTASNITRKSTRLKPLTKHKPWQNVAKLSSTKGRSKRVIFKKNPLKSPSSVATVVTSDYIFFDVGDIVAVTDVDDGQKYYAQLRGFLEDEYYHKSAVITWLIPKYHSHQGRDSFDPSNYVAGPDEELPRDMGHFEFICHAPTDYFKHGMQYKSYHVDSPLLGCVWTTFGPSIEAVDSGDVVSGDHSVDSAEQKLRHIAADNTQKCVVDDDRRSMSFREKTRSHKAGLTRSKDRLMKQ